MKIRITLMATVVAIAAIVAVSCGRINTVSIANDEVSLTCATIAGIPVLCGVYEEATVEVPVETVVEQVIAEVVGEDTPIPPTQTPPANTLTETIIESIQTEYQGEPAALEDVVQDIIAQIPESSKKDDVVVADVVEKVEQLIIPQPTPTTPTQEVPIPQPIQTIVQTVVEEVVEQEKVVETPTEQIADEIIIETVYQDDDGKVETEDIVEDIVEKLPEESKKDDVSMTDVVEKVEEKVEEIKESTTPPDQSSPTPPPTDQQFPDQSQPDWTQVPGPTVEIVPPPEQPEFKTSESNFSVTYGNVIVADLIDLGIYKEGSRDETIRMYRWVNVNVGWHAHTVPTWEHTHTLPIRTETVVDTYNIEYTDPDTGDMETFTHDITGISGHVRNHDDHADHGTYTYMTRAELESAMVVPVDDVPAEAMTRGYLTEAERQSLLISHWELLLREIPDKRAEAGRASGVLINDAFGTLHLRVHGISSVHPHGN